eukprot:COSAG02_NODE_36235_length_457_cov_0.988827_1_plen_123_part_01
MRALRTSVVTHAWQPHRGITAINGAAKDDPRGDAPLAGRGTGRAGTGRRGSRGTGTLARATWLLELPAGLVDVQRPWLALTAALPQAAATIASCTRWSIHELLGHWLLPPRWRKRHEGWWPSG